MKSPQTIEQAEVLLCNLLALRNPRSGDFRIDHDDIVVTLQTAINLLRMAQGELYCNTGFSMAENITVLNEWNDERRKANRR